MGLARPGTAPASVPAGIATGLRKPFFLVSIMVFLLVVGAVAFSAMPGFFVMSKVFGAILAVFFLIDSIRSGSLWTAEVLLYASWLAWCVLGIFGSPQPVMLLTYWTTAFQIWVLVLIISNYASQRGGIALVFVAYIIAVFITGMASVLSGSYAGNIAEERLTGMNRNANGFARMMVYATFCMMYFWMLPTRAGLKHVVLAVGMVAAAILDILSGSRFGVLGMALLYILWLWYSYRKAILSNLRVFVMILLIGGIGASAFILYAKSSVVGGRLTATWDTLVTGTAQEGSTVGRLRFYKQGFDMLMESPLVGVGLGTFYGRIGQPPHSDLIDVAVGSGLPGVILYYAIYAMLWRRAGRIRKEAADPVAARMAGLIRAFVVVVVFLGLGGPNYYAKDVWLLLGCCIGYTLVARAQGQAAIGGLPPYPAPTTQSLRA